MQRLKFQKHDGGRMASGIQGKKSDCVVRALAIAMGRPYAAVHRDLQRVQQQAGRKRMRTDVTEGVYTKTKAFQEYMWGQGWTFISTMQIGSGCRVHLRADQLPKGRLIVKCSRHYCAVVDHVLLDTHDCSREGTRCVYGYWLHAATQISRS